MDSSPDTTVARVPITVRCLDAHGRPVSLSARTLGRGSTDLQELLRRAYAAVRGDAPTESVSVSFLEEHEGKLQLEYLVVEGTRPSRWPRRRKRRRAEEIRTGLMQATIAVTVAVEAVGAITAACTARWSRSDSPDFADLVLDGTRTVRLPAVVREWLHDDAGLELLRGILAMFLDDDVEQLIIGKDPELPGRYQESVVTRSPGLLHFLGGAPLGPLLAEGPDRS